MEVEKKESKNKTKQTYKQKTQETMVSIEKKMIERSLYASVAFPAYLVFSAETVSTFFPHFYF